MTSDDLKRPLRRRNLLNTLRQVRLAPLSLVAVALAAGAIMLAGWLYFANDPLGGEPRVVLAIDKPAGAAESPDSADLGIRKSIEDGGANDSEAALRAEATDAQPAARPVTVAALVEKGPSGPLPKIAADGRMASDVYARKAAPEGGLPPKAAKIAIVIGGMGLSESATSDALNKLPGAVTLAFAPYPSGLRRWVAMARHSDREVMLHLPMEPFDYPDNDPGPKTLLTSLPAADNIQRLHWLMSRFGGYIGVLNYMGAKFTASADALAPVMGELGKRGLIYLDDGGSARSQAMQIGPGVKARSLKADVIVDAVQSDSAIESALERLETIALEKGQAIAVGSSLPVTVDLIAEWAQTLERKGIVLVPLSALAKSTSKEARNG